MLLLLLRWLSSHCMLRVPAVFSYYSTRMLLAAITSLCITILIGPWVIRKLYALKTGQTIRVEDCPLLAELHKKKKETPTMGGILILTSMLVALLLWMDLTSVYTLILGVTTVVLGSLGALDDYAKMKKKNSKGVSPRLKLVIQGALAFAVGGFLTFCPSLIETKKAFHPPIAKEHVSISQGGQTKTMTVSLTSKELMGRYFLPFKKGPFLVLQGIGLLLSLCLIAFVIVGASNAVNLTDGLDGLASGTIVMVASVFALVSFLSNHVELSRYLNITYIEGSGEIGIYLCALIGANLGFLWYNAHPAQLFMGDTGSLAMGGILGVCAVLMRREFLLALVGGVFVLEALSVIIQVGSYRLRNKKRVFLCAPLHHHFEYKGWSETKVVLRFWILGFILSMIGIISLKFQ